MVNKRLTIFNVAAENGISRFEEFFNFCHTICVKDLKELLSHHEKTSSDMVVFWDPVIDESFFDAIRLVLNLQETTHFLIISACKHDCVPEDLKHAPIIFCSNHVPTILTEMSNIAHSLSHVVPNQDKVFLESFLYMKKNLVLVLIHIPSLARYRRLFSLDAVYILSRQIKDFLESYRPKNTRVFQVDSDSFVLLFTKGNITQAIEFVHSLDLLRFEHDFLVNDREVDVEFLSGIVQGQGETLLPRAYSALKMAQQHNVKLYVFDQSDREFLIRQESQIYWINEVNSAIKTERIIPHYQPILNNHTGMIEKYEALARLISIDGEAVLPHVFLESIKESGLMNNLTMSIINRSFQTFKDNDFEFSINIPEESLHDRRLINYLLNRCERYGIKANRVLLEILEDANSTADEIAYINELHHLGFKIAIDDFGVANSNFGRLIDMKVDYIKIDGSFIKNIDHDERSYQIVASIAQFAKSIGAKSVAEFVHSKKVHQTVCELGVDYSQGFLFGKPHAFIDSNGIQNESFKLYGD